MVALLDFNTRARIAAIRCLRELKQEMDNNKEFEDFINSKRKYHGKPTYKTERIIEAHTTRRE